MKKIISLLVALAMLFCTIPVASAANHPFSDVTPGSWYETYVDYCYQNGLMSGTSNVSFEPNTKMTRGMIVTVLYRIAGEPTANAKHPFTDVASSEWYAAPIAWAYENGVVSGTSSTTFSPNANVTREQMVTIFYRYAKSNGCNVSKLANLSGYTDASGISSYATESFQWAVANGIITGTDATHLLPNGDATRAQCATIIQRYVVWTEGGSIDTPTAPTTEQRNALAEALEYLSVIPFSRQGLIDQLKYEGYSNSAAVYAADHCGANWNEQALKSAKSYLEFTAFSYAGLIDQLEYEGYTTAQATYGADHCGANWNEQAARSAAEYLELMSFSRDRLIAQLEYEGFTHEQAVYGVTQNGL